MGRTSSEVKARWNAKAYDQVAVTVPKGRRKTMADYAAGKGESVNGLINRLLMQEIGLTPEEWKKPPETAAE